MAKTSETGANGATSKKLSDTEVKKLWETALKLDRDYGKAREAAETAHRLRSAAVKAIADAMGTGPFETPIGRLTISSRGSNTINEAGEKVPTGQRSYFFKGAKGEVTVIKL